MAQTAAASTAQQGRALHQEVRDLAELSRRDVIYNFAYLVATWAVIAGAITLLFVAERLLIGRPPQAGQPALH